MPRARPTVAAVVAAGVALPLTVFVALAVYASRSPVGADRSIFAQLYGASAWSPDATPGGDSRFLRWVMPQALRLNDDREVALLMILGLAGLLVTRRLRAVVFVVLAVAIVLATPLLKSLFDRESPLPIPGQTAFPSGHGLGSMAIAAAAVVLAWGTRWRWPVLVAAGLFVAVIGMAVVGDGGHWPSDVLAGWCLAVIWVSLLWLGARTRATGEVGAFLRVPGWRPLSAVRGPGAG